jgi:hypothetical protein
VWDGRAARGARAGFVGVSTDPQRTIHLRGAGASAVVPHFQPPGPFWAAVQAAIAQRHSAKSN